MSDYPNMSYCMCENTLLAMRQVINAMNEQGADFLNEMGCEEKRSYEALFSLCEDFMTLSEELQEEAESEDEYDGQPDEAQEWHDFDPDC
jgi:hypothetical protein